MQLVTFSTLLAFPLLLNAAAVPPQSIAPKLDKQPAPEPDPQQQEKDCDSFFEYSFNKNATFKKEVMDTFGPVLTGTQSLKDFDKHAPRKHMWPDRVDSKTLEGFVKAGTGMRLNVSSIATTKRTPACVTSLLYIMMVADGDFGADMLIAYNAWSKWNSAKSAGAPPGVPLQAKLGSLP